MMYARRIDCDVTEDRHMKNITATAETSGRSPSVYPTLRTQTTLSVTTSSSPLASQNNQLKQ
jgi:hypothetical protein